MFRAIIAYELFSRWTPMTRPSAIHPWQAPRIHRLPGPVIMGLMRSLTADKSDTTIATVEDRVFLKFSQSELSNLY